MTWNTNLAIFDLDHTLLAADSSESWAAEMQRLGWIKDNDFWTRHREMMDTYNHADLDMEAYLALNLSPLIGRQITQVEQAARAFVRDELMPLIYPEARELVESHRASGDHLLMISASESFLVMPIAQALHFDGVIGIDVELEHGCLTGRPELPLSYQAGKITHLQAYLSRQAMKPGKTCFYSDSHNDLPLLLEVDEPRPTNPNQHLLQEAISRGWSCLQLQPPIKDISIDLDRHITQVI